MKGTSVFKRAAALCLCAVMLWGGALVLVATGLVTGFNPLQWLGALRRTDD